MAAKGNCIWYKLGLEFIFTNLIFYNLKFIDKRKYTETPNIGTGPIVLIPHVHTIQHYEAVIYDKLLLYISNVTLLK